MKKIAENEWYAKGKEEHARMKGEMFRRSRDSIDGQRYEGVDASILDKIHRKKIHISDAIYVVNIDGYIGNSTKNEIEYAKNNGKEVIYHERID